MPWICDGVPKDGKNYPQAIPGGHASYENHGPDCNICGLPQEAMIPARGGSAGGGGGGSTTVVTTSLGGQKTASQWLIPLGIILGILVLAGGGYGLSKILFSDENTSNTTTTSSPSSSSSTSGKFISSKAKNKDLISQGEKILLDQTDKKEEAAQKFSEEDWGGAIAAYQEAVKKLPTDPEAKIYLGNAQAQEKGKPLTIAVVVRMTSESDKNSAKEVLRGVAEVQDKFNQKDSERWLQVVIVNDEGGNTSQSIAQDLVDASEVLGVIGHGIDQFSEDAITEYETAKLAILSPRTTQVTDGSNPTLKTVSMKDTDKQLFSSYIEAVGKTLSEYAAKKYPAPKTVIFYNSDSDYSKKLKDSLNPAIKDVKGTVVKEIDIKSGFDAKSAVDEAIKSGAKVGFLAVNKGKLTEAVSIAEANAGVSSPMLLLGGDELYTPEILTQGGKAIEGLILAVPWSFQENDPFAREALNSWQGRVNWRTATAKDATQVLADTVREKSTRSEVVEDLNKGRPVSKDASTKFSVFDQVPLVEAKPGKGGPEGSGYVFSAIY